MSKNNIIVKTSTGTLLELSYPKRISKFEIEFEFIKDISNKYFKDAFSNISHGMITNNFNECVDLETIKNSFCNVKNLILVTKRNSRFKVRPVVNFNADTFEYTLNMVFYAFNAETKKYDKVTTKVELELSKQDTEVITKVFNETGKEIRNYSNAIEDISVSFYVSREALNADNLDNVAGSILPFFKFSTIEDEKWSTTSSLSKTYLERIFNLYLNKKYKFNNICQCTLEDWTKNSSYSINIEEILKEAKTTKNNLVSFPLHSILVKKETA